MKCPNCNTTLTHRLKVYAPDEVFCTTCLFKSILINFQPLFSEESSQWQKYKIGVYEKKFYDIKTVDGRVFYQCWPNAGYFWPTHIRGSIPGFDVVYIKESDKHPLDND